MKVLLQRVQHATLTARFPATLDTSPKPPPVSPSPVISHIGHGLLLYLSVGVEDESLTTETLTDLVQKISNGRFFSRDFVERLGIEINHSTSHQPKQEPNHQGSNRLTLSLQEIRGSLLLVSQITLHGALKKGLKPSFDMSAGPVRAREVYEHFYAVCKTVLGTNVVKTGVFGAHMDIEASLDGPITFMVEVS